MVLTYVACLSVFVLSQVIALPIKPVDLCVVGNATYTDGESWLDGCEAHCTCYVTSGIAEIGCNTMCPPLQPKEGCRWVVNPKRDEANSLDCCPVEECEKVLPVCVENGVTIPEGLLIPVGNKWCGCSFGVKQCF